MPNKGDWLDTSKGESILEDVKLMIRRLEEAKLPNPYIAMVGPSYTSIVERPGEDMDLNIRSCNCMRDWGGQVIGLNPMCDIHGFQPEIEKWKKMETPKVEEQPMNTLDEEIDAWADNREAFSLDRRQGLIDSLIEDREFREETLTKILKDMSYKAILYNINDDDKHARALEHWVKTILILFRLYPNKEK